MSANARPIIVMFEELDAFLAEIQRDHHLVERQIIRVAIRRRYDEPFVSVSVIATGVIEQAIIKFEQRIGESLVGQEKAHLIPKAKFLVDKVSDLAKAIGLDVRAGVYE